MKLSEIDWKRGFTRIYILVVCGWFLYWLLWVPGSQMRMKQQLNISATVALGSDAQLLDASLSAQYVEIGKELAGDPSLLFFILIPPVIGFGLLRLLFLTTGWLIAGFSSRKEGMPNNG